MIQRTVAKEGLTISVNEKKKQWLAYKMKIIS